MTTVLVETASVHTTAAACDYLAERLGADDRVIVLGVVESDTTERDAGDAANVARTRLLEPAVEVLTREGDPAETIAAVADEYEADEVVLGATRGDPAAAGEPPGATVTAVLASASRPVVVLPSPAP